jgi:hypothetical protein
MKRALIALAAMAALAMPAFAQQQGMGQGGGMGMDQGMGMGDQGKGRRSMHRMSRHSKRHITKRYGRTASNKMMRRGMQY